MFKQIPILSDESVRSVLNGAEGKAGAVLTREEQQICEPEGGKMAIMSGLSQGTPAFEGKGRIGLRIRKLRLQGRLLHKRGHLVFSCGVYNEDSLSTLSNFFIDIILTKAQEFP